MAEQEWLRQDVVSQYLVMQLKGISVARTKAGRRKLRLFGCACCRLLWNHLRDDLCRAIEIAELFADGKAAKHDLAKSNSTTEAILAQGNLSPDWVGTEEPTGASMVGWLTQPNAFDSAFVMTCYDLRLSDSGEMRPDALLCKLLRDIFGNPFRPVTFSPSWRTDTAVSLARTMYESREFSAMPILADALQDAGCDNEDILSHCRSEGLHVRGCWVVDLVLGKS